MQDLEVSYSDKLRWLADYLDAHPAIAARISGRYDYPSVGVWTENWEEFQELISHLDGYEKGGYSGDLSATHIRKTTGNWTAYRVAVHVSGVCERRPKLDDDGQPVTRKKSVYVETEEEEVVMEYDCPKVWSV